MGVLAGISRRVRGPGSVARNTAFSATYNLVRLAVGFALLPLLKNGIGVDRTGLFLFATTLTGYFAAVDVSVTSSVTRYVAEHRARGEISEVAATLRTATLVMASFGLLAALVLAVVAIFAADALFPGHDVRASAEPTFFVAAATSAAYWPSRVGVAALNGVERYDQAAQVQIVSSVVLLGALGWLAHDHASVTLLCGIYGVITVLQGVFSGILAVRPLGASRAWSGGDWLAGARIRGMVKFGGAAFVLGISDTLINGFDRAIVGGVIGSAAIFAYDAAQRPQQGIRTIASVPGLALVSPVARLWATGEHQRTKDLVLIATFLSVVVPVPIGVLVIVLAKPFVIAWLGASSAHYAPYIVLFASYWLFNCSTVGVSAALYGIGRLESYSKIVIIGALVSLPLSVGLTYAWGLSGVIWGTLIPSAIAVPVFFHFTLPLFQISLRSFVKSVLLPAYGTVLIWATVVVVMYHLTRPSGYAGIVAFSVPALLVYWIAFGPMLRKRVAVARAARRDPALEVPGGAIV